MKIKEKAKNSSITIISLIIGLSGWVTLFYQNIQSNPKIKGEIICEIGSLITNNSKDTYIYSPYIFLTNLRSNSVYIRSLFLEFKYKGETIRLEPDYTIKQSVPNNSSADEIKGQLSFNSIANNSIFYKELEVKYGSALQGFVSFPMDRKYENYLSQAKYKLIIIDIFGREYEVEQNRKFHWFDIDWFEHFSGVKLYNMENDSLRPLRKKYN